jgi:hypothetical protein
MLIKFDDGSPFAQGAAGYNTVPGYELSAHIVLMVEIGDATHMSEVVVDTSSPYLVLDASLARSAGIDLARPDHRVRARIQGEWFAGGLFSTSLQLLADEGDSLAVDGVFAFVPDRHFDPDPLPPAVLGFSCCLDNFLFAIDPNQRRFYFG